jgi:prolyl 4-hydroxylase
LAGKPAESAAPEALNLVREACGQRNAPAFLLHAALAARGIGRSRDINDAYAYVREAAGLGHQYAKDQLAILGNGGFDSAPWVQPLKLRQLAEAPRVFGIRRFLPRHICEWLMLTSVRRLEPATIFMPNGVKAPDPARTNMSAALNSLEGDLVQQLVSQRIAQATSAPVTYHEPINILRYRPGEEYKPHFDFIRPEGEEGRSYAGEIAQLGQRAITVLVYLNDGYEGGETAFPRLDLNFKAELGDALLFWSVSAKGELERNSLHAGLPVASGEKWVLSQWIREKPHPLI